MVSKATRGSWACYRRTVGTREYVPCHMIAAFFELNHSLTSMAALPPFLLRLLEELVRLFVSGTLPRIVHLPITPTADLRPATTTLTVLPAVLVAADVLGLDPVAAPSRWAVNSVSRRELGVFPVPSLLKVGVEELLDVLERDVVGRAALRRHVLGVVNGELEASLQTRVAHSMSALQPRALLRRYFLIHANNALDATDQLAKTRQAKVAGGLFAVFHLQSCWLLLRISLDR